MSVMQIPGFEMIEKLGEGGMATVWKARQISLDRIVAIKILSTRLASDSDPSDIQRFQTEAQSEAKLKHPGIVQVYDANVVEDVYYFVMEYIAGYTVGDWARRKGVLSEKDALLVADCVADALDYAWNKEGIIHCDIKPDNIIIDSDGTVKVADLGLARTISAMSDESLSDEITGTPTYMSPEQSNGEPDLDCRADIYSLGAMIYYLVTGKLLFEGHSDEEVMDMQITDSVDDALDINPKVSKAICWMIEKMLAKNKEERQSDWAAVRADIACVKRKRSPRNELPAKSISTMRRSEQRKKLDYVRPARAKKRGKTTSSAVPLLIAAGIIGAIVIGLLVAKELNRPPARIPIQHPVTQQKPKPKPLDEKVEKRKLYESARQWAADHPDKYSEAISRFQQVATKAKGTEYALRAQDEIRRLVTARRREADKVMAKLQEESFYYIKGEEFGNAADIYAQYSGPLAAETKSKRIAIANELHSREGRLQEPGEERQKKAQEKMSYVLDRVVMELVGGSVNEARLIVAKARKDSLLADKKEDLDSIRKVLDDVANMDNRILDSFKVQKEKNISVQMMDGKKMVIIDDVKDGQVFGRQRMVGTEAHIGLKFRVKDLDVRERLRRMGSDDLPEVALAKGLIALNSGAYSHAKKYFSKTHPLLIERLIAYVSNKLTDNTPEKALARLMGSLGMSMGSFNSQAWLRIIAAKEFSSETVARIGPIVANYRRDYGNTQFAEEAEPILIALTQVKSKPVGKTIVYCNVCAGHGIIKCFPCNGAGDIECPNPKCHGGNVRGRGGPKPFRRVFPGAKRKGHAPPGAELAECQVCEGKAKVKCSECDGKGTLKCGECDGTGKKVVHFADRILDLSRLLYA